MKIESIGNFFPFADVEWKDFIDDIQKDHNHLLAIVPGSLQSATRATAISSTETVSLIHHHGFVLVHVLFISGGHIFKLEVKARIQMRILICVELNSIV